MSAHIPVAVGQGDCLCNPNAASHDALCPEASFDGPIVREETPRNASRMCAQSGCKRSPATGSTLVRVNPRGEPGIFMCHDHEAMTW